MDLQREQPAGQNGLELDGTDQPVEPYRLLVTGSVLWGAWLDCRPGIVPEVLVGLSANGIIPTIAVAIASGLPYHLARRSPERDASDELFLVSGRVRGKRVLVVHDEVTHGHTLAGFVSALRDEAADVVGVLCLIEDASGAGRRRVESTGVALCAAKTL